ncbi:MAG: hypothetical protein FP816_07870 [Desulfobacteraceae bacterium]|nr:hypothetical protein [Desulfobacteraceae bacterium]
MNPLLIAAGFSWVLAQTLKVLIGLWHYGSQDRPRILWRILWAGGMPSTHSAMVSSSTVVTFLSSGGQSVLFGLSLILACIVIYDRSRMHSIYCRFQDRYPVFKKEVQNDPMLKDLMGHRLSELLAGVLIGLASGVGTMQLFAYGTKVY